MNYIDYLIAAFIIIGFILGYRDGFLRKLIGLAGFIAAVLLAFEFSNELGKIIVPIFNNELYFAEIVAGLLIFLVTLFVTAVLKRIFTPVDRVNRFFNQSIGGIAGILQMLIFISAFLIFLNIFDLPGVNSRNNSFLYQKAYNIIPFIVDYSLGVESNTQDLIQRLFEQQSDTLYTPQF